MRHSRRQFLALALVLFTAAPALSQSRDQQHWVATWATALVSRPTTPPAGRGQGAAAPAAQPTPAPAPGARGQGGAAPPGGRQGGPPALPPVTIANQTLRQIVRTTVGGSQVRIVVSNAFGTAPIEIGAAHIGTREREAALAAGSKPVTFAGQRSGTILPGAVLVSDAVDLHVAPLTDLAIDLFLPSELGAGGSPITTHLGASQTNYISTEGNHAGAAALPVAERTTSWFLLARVEVMAPRDTRVVVAIGADITHGARWGVEMNARWPDVLARRLAAERSGPRVAVLNAGISGNRVLGDGAGVSALARFDRDVLMQTGVTHVIVLEGINDIGIARSNPSPSADDLIAGHRQLIERARARGVKVIGATLTPFEGAAYWSPEGEAKRQALNQWIRTSGAYDGVIDFDAITRDPAAPTRFLPAHDSGDRLHPGDAGYAAMGTAIDLALLRR
jgi:lysophospholipase L1-like esterase